MVVDPLVSIVMPAFRVETFIATAIDSVLAQTYSNFELIVVNDGSDDDSVQIVKTYADPRVRLIHQDNAGLAAARNTGIAAAAGAYIAFLDSDDFWHEEKLARHVAHLQSDAEVGVSFAGSILVDESGTATGTKQTPQLRSITTAVLLCRNPIGNGSAPVIRREVFAETATVKGGRTWYFDENLRQSEDVEYWVRIAIATNWIFEGIEGYWTYYRVNSNGLSANIERQFAAWKTACVKNGVRDPAFFAAWYKTAAAFQCRYLARRAVQSGEAWTALRMIVRALAFDTNALVRDGRKTIGTLAGIAAISFLPRRWVDSLQKAGGNLGV